MATSRTEQEVKERAKKLLAGAGVDDNSADYLADLYAKSDRGKANQNNGPIVPAASCGTGIVPLF